jgi:hypothetical protein
MAKQEATEPRNVDGGIGLDPAWKKCQMGKKRRQVKNAEQIVHVDEVRP